MSTKLLCNRNSILVHNGYQRTVAEGDRLEDDIEAALKEAEIAYERGRDIMENGKPLGEIDFETANHTPKN